MYVAITLLLFLTVCKAITVNLVIEDDVVHTIDTSQFLSFNFDTSMVMRDFAGINWANAVLLARPLTPCYLRVGGTDSEFMIFEGSGAEKAGEPPLTHGFPRLDGNFNFTRAQFDRINWFVKNAGLKLMFDLNGVYDRRNGTWNPSNTVNLLNYASEMKYVMDFELGNEPDLYPLEYKITSTELVNNYRVMRSILNSFPMYKGSRLMGPAVASPRIRNMYQEFLEKGGLDYVDAVTLHHYYGAGAGKNVSFFIDAHVLDQLKTELQFEVSLVEQNTHGNRRQIWLGETSSTYNGGTAGISNSYAAGFMWMDKLALCALHGIDAVFRQTFYLSNYAMTDAHTLPLPDYWLSLLFRTFIGNQVLNVTTYLDDGDQPTSENRLRFYAHKNATHMVLFGMNLLPTETADVWIFERTGQIMQYLMEPVGGILTATQVSLNGQKLIFDGQNPPSLINMGVPINQPIRVPSLRYGMWVWQHS